MNTTERRIEAIRIAASTPIIKWADDWTSFELGDDLETVDGTYRTFYTWNVFRFEGAVYVVKSA